MSITCTVGVLEDWNGGHGLNMLFMRFALLSSSLAWNYNKGMIQTLQIGYLFAFSCYLFSRLDQIRCVFLMISQIRCNLVLQKKEFLCFTRLNPCVAYCSTDSIPWVHNSREEGSLDYDRGFVRQQIQSNFDTTINHQQPPFSGAVAGEQAIKIQSSIVFSSIFPFFFSFFFCIY